jgi:hypothetical protein
LAKAITLARQSNDAEVLKNIERANIKLSVYSGLQERYHRDGPAWHYRIGAYCVWRAARLHDRQPDVAARYRRALHLELELLEHWR